MVKTLREQNKGKIIFINSGIFYIAIEEDAVLLNEQLNLKCTCFQKETCKVGVPIKSLGKYLKEIEKLKYSYIVYNLDKKTQTLQKIREFEGKLNRSKGKNIDCKLCNTEKENEDKYMIALRKLNEQKSG